MMNILFRPEDEIYLKEFDYPNACSYEELGSKLEIPHKKYDKNVILSPEKLNIICGSFYMIGSMKDIILNSSVNP